MSDVAESESGAADGAKRTRKSPTAFRTISEVASELDVPQHVLRFWESKFSQVKPLKRGGGRRYYRPEDVALLERIRSLLYNDGYTIKGVQKVLRDAGGRKSGVQAEAATVGDNKTEPASTKAVSETAVGALQKRELQAVVEELEALQDLLTRRKR